MILVDADRVSVRRPDRPLFADLSVTIVGGDRLGLVGLNGAGKTTLVRVLTGMLEPDDGTVRHGRDLRIATLDQRATLPAGTVRSALHRTDAEPWEAEAVLDRLGMGVDRLDDDIATLSGGESKRVALARTLVTDCDLLVLDEPTNHLDIDGIAWLEDRLATHTGGLLLVTHDRHLLDAVTTRILEIDRGTGYVHDGGYDGYLQARADRETAAAEAETKRANLARRELAWLRRGAPARTSKAKARIRSATELIEARPQAAARPGELDLHVDTPRLGTQVVELHDVGFAYPGEPSLFSGFELLLDRRERLGIVGINGTGKSTMLDLIAGRLEATTGAVGRGPTVHLGYYDQTGRELDPTQRVRDAFTGGTGEPHWRDSRLLESFWFDADTQFAPIERLSGGERRRLQLVLTLAERPNVLLLDEPTNDLDLDTLRTLEDFLEDFPGAVVVVSHDRAFLERTVDDVVVLDGSGRVGRIPGGYEAWEADRRAALAAPREPSRAKPGRPPGKSRKGSSPSTLRNRRRKLEKQLESLETERAGLQTALDAAGAAGDHNQLADLGSRLAATTAAVTDVEEQWLEISEQLERDQQAP